MHKFGQPFGAPAPKQQSRVRNTTTEDRAAAAERAAILAAAPPPPQRRHSAFGDDDPPAFLAPARARPRKKRPFFASGETA